MAAKHLYAQAFSFSPQFIPVQFAVTAVEEKSNLVSNIFIV